MKTVNVSDLKQWWKVTQSQDEIDLFTCIARNPKHIWRTVGGVVKELGWPDEKAKKIIDYFIKNKMIIMRKGKKSAMIAYWENVKDLIQEKPASEKATEEDVRRMALNKQLDMMRKKMQTKRKRP